MAILCCSITVVKRIAHVQTSRPNWRCHRVLCSPVLSVPPNTGNWCCVLSHPHPVEQFTAICSPFIMLVSCMTCLLFDFFGLITVQMNESLYDNRVNNILYKQYPLDLKKKNVDKYVLRRTTKKYSVGVTPVNNDHSTDYEARPIPWFTTEMARNFLSSKVN